MQGVVLFVDDDQAEPWQGVDTAGGFRDDVGVTALEACTKPRERAISLGGMKADDARVSGAHGLRAARGAGA